MDKTCPKCSGTGHIYCPECKGCGKLYFIIDKGPEGGLTLKKVDPDSLEVREGVIFYFGKPISNQEIYGYCRGTKVSLCPSCRGAGRL